MKVDCISLPEISPGREYIIDHIKNGKAYEHGLNRYGILPGETIKLVFESPAGDPKAYEIMGSVLALRYEDSNNIIVTPRCQND